MKLIEIVNPRSLTVASIVTSLSMMGVGVRAQGTTPKPSATASPATTAEGAATGAKVAGTDVAVPTRKKYVAPEYPIDAAIEGIRGIVILELLIDETGVVTGARVTRSIPGLDEAAIAAVKLWEYEPTKVANKPVKVLLSQSITFALKLPDLQRALGIPELKSGGAPSVPRSITSPESAALAITLGSQGEVREAAFVDGNPALSEALLRAVKSWRFAVSDGPPPQSFTVRADWIPGPPAALLLKAAELKTATASPATPTTPKTDTPASSTAASTATAQAVAPAVETLSAAPAPTPAVETMPARQEPPAKEQGISTVSDVILGDNIPDLVRGRRPVWPPLARLGNATGDVVVRFSIDLAGKVTVHSAEGPDLLKDSAEQAVGTWVFRRTAIDRVHLIATFKYSADRAMAKVDRQPQG